MDWEMTKYAYGLESEFDVEFYIPQGWTRNMYHWYYTE